MDSTADKDCPLKLYHVSRPPSLPVDYEQYRDFVVAAYSKDEARNTLPHHPEKDNNFMLYTQNHDGWVKEEEKDLLIVEEIGYALYNLKPGVIINNFLYS